MLGINNSLQEAKFMKSATTPSFRGDFSKVDIESERDQKLRDVNDVKSNFEDLADTFEQSGSKGAKKAGKFMRRVATVVGLASTFIFAKYGSKITINTFRTIAKSNPVQNIANKVGKLKTPAQKVVDFVKTGTNKILSNPKVADSKIIKGIKKVLDSSTAQTLIQKGKNYIQSAKTALKSINGAKVQGFAENAMATSATASVLIDDLAGRNSDKSNLVIALGASGGDQ